MLNRILIIVAHPDDEVLGCGATIAKHTSIGDDVRVIFLSDGFSSRINGHQRNVSAVKASKLLGCSSPVFLNFPDNQMDNVPLLEIVKKIDTIIDKYNPNIIYTHHFGDLNIDHQITHRAVMTSCRPQPESNVREIYSFEILSSTHWQSSSMSNPFVPNYFVDVSNFITQKIQALACYDDEMRKYPHIRSYDSVNHLAALRGSVVGINLAESFVVERIVNK